MSANLPARFPCPACGSPLRLRERRFVGAKFPCPDCGVKLTLLSLRDGDATVQLAETLESPTSSAPRRALTPAMLLIGGTVLAGGVLIAVMMLSGTPSSTQPTVVEAPVVKLPPIESPIIATKPEVMEPVRVEEPIAVPPRPVIPGIVFDETAEPPISALAAIPLPPPAPVVLRPDPQAVLDQRLIRFHQPTPTPRRELLATVEDFIGRRIDRDETVPDSMLTAAVRVSLNNATVGDLVTEILAGTDLQLAITADAARLQRRGSGDVAANVILIPR